MIRIFPFLLIGALLLIGCSSGSTNDSNSSTPVGATGGGAKLKVVFIPKDTANPYFKSVNEGFEESSKQLGFDYQQQGPATADATSQLSIIKDQIQRKVDVIAIAANSPDALNEALDDAKAKGIIVVTIDSDLTGNETHRAVGVMPTDTSKIGPSQIGIAQVRFAQIRSLQVRFLQIGPRQVSVEQIKPLKISATQVSVVQVWL